MLIFQERVSSITEYFQLRCILMHDLKLNSDIQLKNKKIKTLYVSLVMEKSPKMIEEKFGLSASDDLCGRTWTVWQ